MSEPSSHDLPCILRSEVARQDDPCCETAQERSQLNQIADYFHKDIPEVPYNDEDAFLEVLKKAGLTATD